MDTIVLKITRSKERETFQATDSFFLGPVSAAGTEAEPGCQTMVCGGGGLKEGEGSTKVRKPRIRDQDPDSSTYAGP